VPKFAKPPRKPVIVAPLREPDYYDLLCIPRDATQDEIHAAYRDKAMGYHSDQNRNPRAEAIMRNINEAYKALKDPQRRAAYDLTIGIQAPAPAFSTTDNMRPA
jgi:DnaJ-class molecular chaperone